MADTLATYDPNLTSDVDRMRFNVGDIRVGLDTGGIEQALRPDVEYLALLDLTQNWKLATAEMADSLASEYAQEPDSFSSSGEVSVSWGSRVEQWRNLAQRLRAEVAAANAASVMTAFGIISISPVRIEEQSAEYTSPALRGDPAHMAMRLNDGRPRT
jgi:hypothetical protein